MAGIYIHIPFCKQRCSYCDFYTRVAPLQVQKTVNAIAQEAVSRNAYLQNEVINTIYFGGGTPSLLNASQFNLIFDAVFANYQVNEKAEITFEANPDDLTPAFFEEIRKLPFNRISMGIQSFDNEQLKAVNRRHTGNEAIEAYENARNAGFKNISVDLIYGLPGQSLQSWKHQLDTALALNPEHISIYGLTYEEGTPLFKQRELRRIQSVSDDEMIDMHVHTLAATVNAGYEAYEISNFARPGFRSQHNSAYWKMTPYLGLGPSAHSFNGDARSWNVESIKDYVKAIEEGDAYIETEVLSTLNKYNEYVMVALRTSEGMNIAYLEQHFDADIVNHFYSKVQTFEMDKVLISSNGFVKLTTEGILISNLIIESFIIA